MADNATNDNHEHNDSNDAPEGILYVETDEPQARSAPALETGVLKWVRENLFSSLLNTFLTLTGAALIIFSTVAFVRWTVQDANWFAIAFNFRQFMLGRYEPIYEGRIHIAVIFVALASGAAVAVWIRQATRTLLGTLLATLAAVLLVPPLVMAIIPLPPSYVAAGTAEIQAGSATESPIAQLGFIAQEGQEVRFSIADDLGESDDILADLSGFVSGATNTLRNAAGTRLDQIAEKDALQATIIEDTARRYDLDGAPSDETLEAIRSEFIEAEIDEEVVDNLLSDAEWIDATTTIPLLTNAQRSAIAEEFADIEIPAPLIEQYNVNQADIDITLYDYTSGEAEQIGETVTLSSPDDSAAFDIPADGWYIVEKQSVDEEGDPSVTILAANGVYPVLQSVSYDPDKQDSGGEAVGGFVDTFIRMTDRFSIERPRPEVDDEEIPIIVITNNQYRGDRSFANYLRVFTAPFLGQIAFGTTVIIAASIAGYLLTLGIEKSVGREQASQLATWMLIISPVLIWVMVNGWQLPSIIGWLVLGSVVFAVNIASGVVERAGSHNTGATVGAVVATVALFGVGFWLMNLWGTSSVLVFFLAIAALYGLYSFYNAYQAHQPSDKTQVLDLNGRVIGTLVVIVVIYVGAWLLDNAGILTPEFMGISDPRNWGGLLLTMMLTIYGIIVAFPIGLGLALGRRSDLPAVKYFCTAYIELIRGSPFITVLFFMQLLIPLINPNFANVPNSYRAMVAVIMFSAAYLAENVRGGLQSVPEGQSEAARALGLTNWQTIRLITLPQALRAVIPALVGQFISLFKDTSLVAIVGLIDLVGFVNTMVVQAEFIGTRQEGLLFISIIYFVFSYVMSYVSRLLEASGSGSTRRM